MSHFINPSLFLPMLTCSSGSPPPLLPFVLRSLAFCGPASCAVSHAEKYLQDEVNRCAPDIGSGPNKEVFYPNLAPTNVLGLVHHKNQIISTFLMESVVGERPVMCILFMCMTGETRCCAWSVHSFALFLAHVACSMQALLTNQGQKMEEAPIISREEVGPAHLLRLAVYA